MAEKTNSGNLNSFKIEGTARENSRLYQIGKIVADRVVFVADNEPISPLVERIEQSGKAESVAILKTGDLPKSLAHWQGREEEIKQLHQWLADENILLIGIEENSCKSFLWYDYC